MSPRRAPGVGNAAGVALLVLNVANVPAIIRSTDAGTDRSRLAGYGLAIAAGAASSALARSPWPLLGTVGMCALMLHLQKHASGRDPDTRPTV